MIDWKSQLFESKKSELNKYVLMSDMLHEAKLTKLGKNNDRKEENECRYMSSKSFE